MTTRKILFLFSLSLLFSTRVIASNLTIEEIRKAFSSNNVTALNPKRLHTDTNNEPLVHLGKLLFFDKILSGNKDISCGSCHFPSTGTSDNLPVSIGTGGHGLGEERVLASGHFIPRNAPALFNMGYKSFHTAMWDGRISISSHRDKIILNTPEASINGSNPITKDIYSQINSIAAAQALFPVTSFHEMRGEVGQNEIANAKDNVTVWRRLMKRVKTNDKYMSLFKKAYPEIKKSKSYNYGHVVRAIGAFEMVSFRADNTKFDSFLNGNNRALTRSQVRGASLFVGKANCISCHNGPHLTDFKSYSSGMPQLGPGKEELENSEHGEDRGVLLITDKNADLYKFKTPTLRNVYHTGPWSHAGAYNNLKDFLLHHTNSKLGMENFLSKPDRFIKGQRYLSLIDFDTERNNARVASTDKKLTKLNLSKRELKDLYEFLKSLSDLSHYNRVKVPSQVPSGLSIAP